MTLNCLTCQGLQRTDSETDTMYAHDTNIILTRKCYTKVDRSWSGNLVSPQGEQKIKRSGLMTPTKSRPRLPVAGPVTFKGMVGTSEPRLIRSAGMRRDWSFENLKQRRQEIIKLGRKL